MLIDCDISSGASLEKALGIRGEGLPQYLTSAGQAQISGPGKKLLRLITESISLFNELTSVYSAAWRQDTELTTLNS